VVEHLEIEHALDGATLQRLREEMRAAGDPATVSGLAPERQDTGSVRRVTAVDVPAASRATVVELFERERARIADRFGRQLDQCEEPQFLRYGPGDHFVAHQDGNTPLLHDDTRFRKVSVVVFLSEQSEQPAPATYCGGSLVLHEGYGASAASVTVAPAPGTLVAFPAETTHEVLPITHGERLTIVSWYRSARAGAPAADSM
jgi:SM-20-related protein